jgi:hypothetical protein
MPVVEIGAMDGRAPKIRPPAFTKRLHQASSLSTPLMPVRRGSSVAGPSRVTTPSLTRATVFNPAALAWNRAASKHRARRSGSGDSPRLTVAEDEDQHRRRTAPSWRSRRAHATPRDCRDWGAAAHWPLANSTLPVPDDSRRGRRPALAARRRSSNHGRVLVEDPPRRAQQTISPDPSATAFAQTRKRRDHCRL